MNYLLVGKSGVFETIIAALVFMNKEEKLDDILNKITVFGDINEDNKREPIFIKADNEGNKVYTLGINNYKLISKIVSELAKAGGQKELNLIIITIDIKGDNITYYLSRLGSLPIIGFLFANWAKKWVLSRQDLIVKHCQDMVQPTFHNKGSLAAAKPMK